MRLLRMQAATRTHLETFAELRGALHDEDAQAKADATPPPPSRDAERLKHAIASLSKLFPEPSKPDSSKTANFLHRLRSIAGSSCKIPFPAVLLAGFEALPAPQRESTNTSLDIHDFADCLLAKTLLKRANHTYFIQRALLRAASTPAAQMKLRGLEFVLPIC